MQHDSPALSGRVERDCQTDWEPSGNRRCVVETSKLKCVSTGWRKVQSSFMLGRLMAIVSSI